MVVPVLIFVLHQQLTVTLVMVLLKTELMNMKNKKLPVTSKTVILNLFGKLPFFDVFETIITHKTFKHLSKKLCQKLCHIICQIFPKKTVKKSTKKSIKIFIKILSIPFSNSQITQKGNLPKVKKHCSKLNKIN